MTIVLRKIVLATVLLFGISGLVYAIPVTYDFTASGFSTIFGSTAAPTNDPVSGSFTIDGSTLTAINLTLGSHTYTTSEVGFDPNWSGSEFILGGNLCDINCMNTGTDDFFLVGTLGPTPQFSYFDYVVSTVPDDGWSTFTGTISKVSEPASFPLLGIGLIGLGINRKHRKKTQVE